MKRADKTKDQKRLQWLLNFIKDYGVNGLKNLEWTLRGEEGDIYFDRLAIDRAMKGKGELVAIFLACNGYPGEVHRALQCGLLKGETYIIRDASISQSSSRVKIGDYWFNSVMFDISCDMLMWKFGNPYSSIKSVMNRRVGPE